MLAKQSIITELPFVRSQSEMWVPERTNDYGDDCALGRYYGRELQKHIEMSGNPAAFGAVIRAIVAGGVYEAVEIGFCSHFGIVLAGKAHP